MRRGNSLRGRSNFRVALFVRPFGVAQQVMYFKLAGRFVRLDDGMRLMATARKNSVTSGAHGCRARVAALIAPEAVTGGYEDRARGYRERSFVDALSMCTWTRGADKVWTLNRRQINDNGMNCVVIKG